MRVVNAIKASLLYLSSFAAPFGPPLCAALYAFSTTEGTLFSERIASGLAIAIAIPMVAFLAYPAALTLVTLCSELSGCMRRILECALPAQLV